MQEVLAFGVYSAKSNNVSQAAVIGNGESRKHIDLSLFKKTHTLIGCNAIHRDITVDHLICCDRRMAEEATDNPETKNSLIYVREDWYHYFRKIKKNKNIRTVPELPYKGDLRQDQPINWGSGGYAVLLAAHLGFKEINLIGFDLFSRNDKVNNLYKDTDNYSKSQSQPVDPSYWVYQLDKIFNLYPDTQFIISNDSYWVMPKEWRHSNIIFENISQYTIDK